MPELISDEEDSYPTKNGKPKRRRDRDTEDGNKPSAMGNIESMAGVGMCLVIYDSVVC